MVGGIPYIDLRFINGMDGFAYIVSLLASICFQHFTVDRNTQKFKRCKTDLEGVESGAD
jgi:hypothetical protein